MKKGCNSSISMKEVILPQFYKDLTRKINLFEKRTWFKLYNLGLALGMVLQFYASVAKGLKIKVSQVWVRIPAFEEVTGEKLVGGLFAPPFPHPGSVKKVSSIL